jgi:hypothetical protein
MRLDAIGRWWPVLLIAAVVGFLSVPAIATAEDLATPEVLVPPGSIARWPGSGIEACSAGDRKWPPVDDACWYPVDLLVPEEATLEVRRTRGGHEETAFVRVGPYPYPVQKLRVPDRQVHLSRKDLARTAREEARVAPLWALETSPVRYALALRPPLELLPAGGRFGTRRFFNDEARSPHGGADFSAPAGTPVLAAGDGVVALAEDHFFSGKSVYVDHGGGMITMSFHLSRIDVKAGDEVKAGQRLGSVGATGRATGAHLHFGVRLHGARVNPALLLGPVESVPVLESGR